MPREQKGQKARKTLGTALEALLEPCRLLLLGSFLNTSEEAIIKIFYNS